MKSNFFKIASFLCIIAGHVNSQDVFSKPAKGFWSEKPAGNWQDDLLIGNGTMGALVPGGVGKEVITLNNSFLYLPGKVSGTYVKQGEHLPEIRSLLLNGKYREASAIMATLKKETGYTDTRDPYIPAFNLKIEQKDTSYTEYQRSVNYQTGEASTSWKNGSGIFRRDVFISRADSLLVLRIKGSGKINATFSLERLPAVDEKEAKLVADGFSEINPGLKDGWLTFKAIYKSTNPYAPYSGYHGVARVFNKGGSISFERGRVKVIGADEVLVLLKLEPVVHFDGNEENVLQKFIDAKPADYNILLAAHVKIHGPLFDRVKLDLNAPEGDRALSTEQMIRKTDSSSAAPLAMIEKAFEAGRYNIISCTGSNPPNLIGIWSGQWLSPWSGSFTNNGNLQTAMAFLLPGNTPSLMQAYFRMNDRLMDGFRVNARVLFNCRGIHIPAQMTTTPLETDFTPGYPHSYWTGGAGWAANFYYEYYEYTGDKKFLKNKGYPFMKEAALFLEDFLKVEKEGKFVFVPSYSPENAPGGDKNPAASVNATMDVMITRQLLKNCISAAKLLNVDAGKVKLWKSMLDKMPPYQVSQKEGTLREWLWPGEAESNQHRHASNLYALYNDLPKAFTADSLKAAATKTIDVRFNFDKNFAHGFMAFGITNMGWAAAHLGNAGQTREIVDFLAANYWSVGMASYHNMHTLFNMDISGGFPYLVSQCLVYSEPGYLSLLPALPEDWQKGSIAGLKLKGDILLKKLSWSGKKLEVLLLSNTSKKIRLKLPGKIEGINGNAVASTTEFYSVYLNGGVSKRISFAFE